MRVQPVVGIRVGHVRHGRQLLGQTAMFAAICGVAIATATRVQAPSLAVMIGLAAGLSLGVWMFTCERLERPLAVFLLYLGLLDGFLKLRTGSSAITLGLDALLYAICLGFLARAILRREPLRLPPMSGWVLAFVAAVLVQVANPANASFTHTLGALRPHLEFVPLFFIGYALMQTRRRLQQFFVIMLVIALGNGLVGMVQLNLTPAQLASWGPGYAYRINGNGTGLNKVSGRVFGTNGGPTRTRPFGLGDDAGVGEAWGMLALGGALALVSFASRWPVGRFATLLCFGPPLAIITGEGRGVLIGSVMALFAYVLFATTAKRLVPTLFGVTAGLAAIVGVTALVSSVSGAGVFARYATISPSNVASTTGQDRGNAFAAIPRLLVHHPLGNGLGAVGPASGFAGGGNSAGSNGETEPGFLISELGIPGLLIIYGFNARLLFLGVTRIKRLDPELRGLIAALLAGVVGMLVVGVSSATTATAPFAPFLWFAGGALSYWFNVVAGPRRRWVRPPVSQRVADTDSQVRLGVAG